MAKKRNIESAIVFVRSGIRAIRVRAIEVLLYLIIIHSVSGCHLYAISRPNCSHLRMVVAVGRRLMLFTWKHSAELLAWCCPAVEFDAVDGFTFVRVSTRVFFSSLEASAPDCIKDFLGLSGDSGQSGLTYNFSKW